MSAQHKESPRCAACHLSVEPGQRYCQDCLPRIVPALEDLHYRLELKVRQLEKRLNRLEAAS